MKFEVELTEKAAKDLRNIFLYIAIDLGSPDYENEPWYSRGMRVLPIDHFIILYTPYLEERIVPIVTIMYGGRNISEQLKQLW